jgi:CheY-like chemotaxis protein
LQPYILVVEDDHLQEGPLVDQLKEAFPGGQIDSVCTEHEFRERLGDLRKVAPDLVVMDVMLRWADPKPNSMDPPDEVVQEGFYRAGLRCAELMAADNQLKDVPVILYTILEREDLERQGKPLAANVTYMRKSADLDILLRKARELARSSAL